MKPLRAVFSLLLVVIATVLVGCGGPATKAPLVYTPEKVAELQLYLTPMNEAHDRLGELEGYVDSNDWTNIKSMIHGPFGSLRASAGYINRVLLKPDQKRAVALSEALFDDLEKLDSAASANIPEFADTAYFAVVKDFDAYLNFIPSEPDTEE
ncbi:MAG: photosystem II protein PsbQ [Spirulina sp. SIO3F2]|nr:photosystem II protein PsbQ [Spirulina sp. SIO3F2]